ncbi:hypothetical protein [Chryseobacterium culicis]|uniref:Outer membrane lipoprotein-sorting protein n=1 Tax=Chryseobacterium culicis TaxID=680127 RepID=A0A1H6IJR5_CHRCI|nr:hypothetical protein [Chryseobacterium culicis]SEH49104.1 hypothetical protein SAMN05421593_0098 [Chryseobacterium culicis]
MKKLLVPFFCMVMVSFLSAQNTNNVKKEISKLSITPNEVINNYMEALGGKDKLDAVKSMLKETTMSIEGIDVVTTEKRMGNKYKIVQTAMGMEMEVQVFNGEKGYKSTTTEEGTVQKQIMTEEEIIKAKKSITLGILPIFDPAKYISVTTDKIDDKEYYILSSDKSKAYFDIRTGLFYKTISEGREMIFKEYLIVDGLKLPGIIEVKTKQKTIEMKTTKLILNSGVTESDFIVF